MESMFAPGTREAIAERIRKIEPGTKGEWGTMTPPQMLAHCRLGVQMATGGRPLKRALIGRLLAWMVRGRFLNTDAPLAKNSPTDPKLLEATATDVDAEREQLLKELDAFCALGLGGMPAYPHPFFGKMSPEQWDRLMAKHLDHHLRQFGV